jgi:hypothetical protein
MDPGEPAHRHVAAGLSHSSEAEIDAVGQYGGKQGRVVLGRPTAALVREAFREAGPGVYLEQQISDAHARQGVIRLPLQHVGLRWGDRTQRRDLQRAVVQVDIG